jgi:hypothetical protein
MENASSYINIGKVAYWPFFKRKKKHVLYVMISKDKVQKYGNQTYDVRYTENPDGTGLNTDSIPENVKNEMVIYPEYQNTEYGDFLLGARKDKATLEKEHAAFENALSTFNGKIVLRHDSSYVIKDGVIRKGKPNTYSKDSDIGVYFWGSDKVGKDNSNVGVYTYYCLIDRNQLYDYQTNEERLSLVQALQKYPYAGQFWEDGAIVVNTLKETPIWCIYDKRNDKWFDANWNQIGNPFEKTQKQLNERMGFTDEDVPNEVVDRIWKEYMKNTFARRNASYTKKFVVDTGEFEGFPEHMTFVVEKGKGDDYYKAALYSDGSIHLNVDELNDVSEEEAKSSIAHELVHMTQHEKVASGKRGVGEYGYNQAVNSGMIDDREREKCLWMIEQLQENEIEARLSQTYKYVKQQMEGIQPQGYNMSDYVNMIVENLESITKLNDLEEAIKGTQKGFDINYLWYINLFVKSAQAALYGVKQGNLDLPEAKRLGLKLFSIYKKRFERYRQRVYNTVYQAVHDATTKKASRF